MDNGFPVERRSHPREGHLFEHIKTVMRRIVWRSDATTIRLILATASALWAIGAWLHPQTFDHSPYSVLERLDFLHLTTNAWGVLFMLHFFGVMWRVFDPTRRVIWGLIVNSYGLAIWLSVTLSLTIAVGSLDVDTSTDWALCLFAAWALFKTGARDDLVSP